MKAQGKVFRYKDNVDTDVIIPARYLNTSVPSELAKHCMEDIDKDFVNNVKAGDIIVADKNFGCGSSREHAPIAIKASGISCVIASTFARILMRPRRVSIQHQSPYEMLSFSASSGLIEKYGSGYR